MEPIRLVVGLGNPGAKYELTRHNAGFWLADQLADQLGASFTLDKNVNAWVAKARHKNEVIIIAKPTTYMNRSGEAVGPLMRFFKFAPEQLLVLHDELDLMPGQVRLKLGGGHAGHNGLRDIQRVLGTPAYWRLRLGIGHPRTLGLPHDVANFVLSMPQNAELQAINEMLDRCYHQLPRLLDGEVEAVTMALHTDPPK